MVCCSSVYVLAYIFYFICVVMVRSGELCRYDAGTRVGCFEDDAHVTCCSCRCVVYVGEVYNSVATHEDDVPE